MYFSRYIWIFLRKIYLKRILKKKKRKLKIIFKNEYKKKKFFFNKVKLNFSLKKLSKIPLTYIPNSLKFSIKKKLRKKKIKTKKLKCIFKQKVNLLHIKLYYILNFKYKINFLFKYIFFFYLFIFIKLVRLKYKLKKRKKKITLHNGRFFITRNMPSLNITLSLLTETVTYGMRKKKKKKKNNRSTR